MKILLCILAALVLAGCQTRTILPPTPHTVFTPPTTIPSVSPPIQAAQGEGKTVTEQTANALHLAGELTPDNLSTVKPSLVTTLTGLLASCGRLTDTLTTALVAAAANDTASVRAMAERDAARAMVTQREKEMGEMATAQAKAMAAKDKEIAAAKSEATRMLNWMLLGIVGLGFAVILGGVLLGTLGHNLGAGLVIAGVGVLTSSLGMAGMYFGREIAIGGACVGGLALVGMVWAAIHYLRADGQSIVQGVEQGRLSGIIPADVWNKLKPLLASVQTPGAVAMVKAETQ